MTSPPLPRVFLAIPSVENLYVMVEYLRPPLSVDAIPGKSLVHLDSDALPDETREIRKV
jgi:hypothetical protein